MRFSPKNSHATNHSKDIFGVDFHDFLQSSEQLNQIEIAKEFGVSLKDVKKLKESINRA